VEAVEVSGDLDGLLRWEVPPELCALTEDDADVLGVSCPVAVRLDPVHERRTGGWHQDPREQLDRRGLAGAVGAEISEELSARDLEADVFHGDDGLALRVKQRAEGRAEPRVSFGHAELFPEIADVDDRPG